MPVVSRPGEVPFFSVPSVPVLDGLPCPPGWERFSILRRVAWLHREGPAADPLEAAEWLRALGEWPVESSRGLSSGGRRDRLSKYY